MGGGIWCRLLPRFGIREQSVELFDGATILEEICEVAFRWQTSEAKQAHRSRNTGDVSCRRVPVVLAWRIVVRKDHNIAIREHFSELRIPAVSATTCCRNVSMFSRDLDRFFAFHEQDQRIRVRERNFIPSVQRRLDGLSPAGLPAASVWRFL